MSDQEIFADLDTNDIIALQSALLSLFNGISTIDGRKSFFTCAGVDEDFISNLDWNIKISESVEILVAKSIGYRIRRKNPNYHPLVNILFYILHKPEGYNLDDRQIDCLEYIHYIGQKEINLFKPKKSKYRTLLEQERQEETQTSPNTTKNKIDKKIIVKYDLEDLEDVLEEKYAYKGVFAFSVSSSNYNILNNYIIERILNFWQEKTGRYFYKKNILISDTSFSLIEDIEKELKEDKICENILELAQSNTKLNIFIIIWNHILPPLILEKKTRGFFEELERSYLNYLDKKRQCLVFILADTNSSHNSNGFVAIKTPSKFILDGKKGLLEWFSNELSICNFADSEIDSCINKLKRQNGDLTGTYQMIEQIIERLNGRI